MTKCYVATSVFCKCLLVDTCCAGEFLEDMMNSFWNGLGELVGILSQGDD